MTRRARSRKRSGWRKKALPSFGICCIARGLIRARRRGLWLRLLAAGWRRSTSAASPNAPPPTILDGWSANVDDSQRRRAFAMGRSRNAATSPGFIIQRAITSMATISAEFAPVRVAASADLDETVRLVLACPQRPLAVGGGRRNSSQWSCRNSMETSAVARVSGSRAARRFVGGVRSPNSVRRFRKAAEFPGC